MKNNVYNFSCLGKKTYSEHRIGIEPYEWIIDEKSEGACEAMYVS